MRAIVSCVAYENFEEVKSKCKALEFAINQRLKNHQYGSIRFLTPRFSFISLIQPETPTVLNQNNLSFTVTVQGNHISQIALAFVNELRNESVPENLRADIIRIFEEEGWIK